MTFRFDRDIRAMVDFNAARRDGTITASARYAQTFPDVGSFITLYDPEHNECLAIVEEINRDRGVFRCRLDWDSWRSESVVFESGLPSVRYASAAA